MGCSILNSFGWVILLSLVSVTSFAKDDPPSLGVGTEIVFFKKPGSQEIALSECFFDSRSSCMVLEKDLPDIESIVLKSKNKCTFKFENINSSKLIPLEQPRKMVIKDVKRDDNMVVSASLEMISKEGKKQFVLLSCSKYFENKNGVMQSESYNQSLTENILTGFKEFELGKVVLDQPVPIPTEPKSSPVRAQSVRGSAI